MVSAQSRYYVAINFSSMVNFWHQSVTFGNKRHRFISIICFFYWQHVIFKQIKESRNTKRVILVLYYISGHFYYFQYSAKTNTGITYSYHLIHALIHWYFNNVIAKFILKWIEREIWKKKNFFQRWHEHVLEKKATSTVNSGRHYTQCSKRKGTAECIGNYTITRTFNKNNLMQSVHLSNNNSGIFPGA